MHMSQQQHRFTESVDVEETKMTDFRLYSPLLPLVLRPSFSPMQRAKPDSPTGMMLYR